MEYESLFKGLTTGTQAGIFTVLDAALNEKGCRQGSRIQVGLPGPGCFRAPVSAMRVFRTFIILNKNHTAGQGISNWVIYPSERNWKNSQSTWRIFPNSCQTRIEDLRQLYPLPSTRCWNTYQETSPAYLEPFQTYIHSAWSEISLLDLYSFPLNSWHW